MLSRIVIVTAASVAALSAVANAADIYRPVLPAPYNAVNWSGFYVGVHAGSASSSVNFNDTDPFGGSVLNGGLKGTGFIGGAQLGYNRQLGHFVFGVEADLGDLSNSSSKSVLLNTGWIVTSKTAGGFYGDVAARLGFAFDKALVYAKGGYAYLGAADKFSGYDGLSDSLGDSFSTSTTGVFGWTVGAGVEYLVTPAWSVRAEYQHFEFGDASNAVPAEPGNVGGGSGKFTNASADTVTAGISYHFGR